MSFHVRFSARPVIEFLESRKLLSGTQSVSVKELALALGSGNTPASTTPFTTDDFRRVSVTRPELAAVADAFAAVTEGYDDTLTPKDLKKVAKDKNVTPAEAADSPRRLKLNLATPANILKYVLKGTQGQVGDTVTTANLEAGETHVRENVPALAGTDFQEVIGKITYATRETGNREIPKEKGLKKLAGRDGVISLADAAKTAQTFKWVDASTANIEFLVNAGTDGQYDRNHITTANLEAAGTFARGLQILSESPALEIVDKLAAVTRQKGDISLPFNTLKKIAGRDGKISVKELDKYAK